MNKWSELTEALSELPIFKQLNDEKRQLDTIRPLSEEVEGRVMQKIRLDWNYHSNAIEGNKLTYGETYTLLMYDLPAKGKTIKDHTDIKGHNKAIDFIATLVEDDADLTEVDIRNLHKIVLVEPYKSPAFTLSGQETYKIISLGEYKKMPNNVKTPTGEIHYYSMPEEVPILMSELVSWYNKARKNPKIHPSVLAAFFHHRFVFIHPFDDGNGRVARILMNLILMQNGYPPAIVKIKERNEYYSVLNQADKKEYQPLVEHIAEAVSDSLNIYLKAAKGESIEDSSDLDKEIALFKGSFDKTYKIKDKETTIDILQNIFLPIAEIAELKFYQFDDLFLENNIQCYYEKDSFSKKKGVVTETVPFKDKEFIDHFGLVGMGGLDDIAEKEFDRFIVSFYWFNFKQSAKYLDFDTELFIRLGRVDYQIVLNKEILLSKHYSDNITDLEKQEVANKWVRQAFDDLKKKIEEANKE